MRPVRPLVLAAALALAVPAMIAVAPGPAQASVTNQRVTPDNVDATEGIAIAVSRDGLGNATLTLTLAPAAVAVYAPELAVRPDAKREKVEWASVDETAYVAEIEVAAVDLDSAVITVMRDDGLVGHRYQVHVADWVDDADD